MPRPGEDGQRTDRRDQSKASRPRRAKQPGGEVWCPAGEEQINRQEKGTASGGGGSVASHVSI